MLAERDKLNSAEKKACQRQALIGKELLSHDIEPFGSQGPYAPNW
jgi:hypothetical protein